MTTYNDLKPKVSPEFSVWMCNLSPEDGLPLEKHTLSLLITRAIEGLNRGSGRKILDTLNANGCRVTNVSKDKSNTSDHKTFLYKNYQAGNNLTSEDLARLDALLMVWEARK